MCFITPPDLKCHSALFAAIPLCRLSPFLFSNDTELAEAAVCQNLASLRSFTFQIGWDNKSGSRAQLSTLHWDAAHEILLDVLQEHTEKLDNDDNAAIYAFENGARIITAVNTPLTFTPAAGVVADNSSAPYGLDVFADGLGFDIRDVTG